MLRPSEIDAVLLRGARARSAHRTAAPNSARPPNSDITSQNRLSQTGLSAADRKTQSLPSDSSAPGTGINHWWRYQEQNVPGGGHTMINIGTGNLLLQQDDMAVPHKGIAMAFRRTYNSQSPPTFSGDLASYTTMYGNGWTNTFDAHLVRTSPRHFAVFDIDGARYDYVMLDGHSISSSPGDHSHLDYDGACGNTWTKKSGTIYYFYNSSTQTDCPQIGAMGGYAGRLYQIIGRNRNTYITFTYAWDNGDASVTGKISTITATTESGMAATLSFADVNGRRLLQTVTYPDGSTNLQYGYDANGNLISVSRPPNNGAGIRPTHLFGYQSIGTDSIIQWVASPRWCGGSSSGCGYDGGYLYWTFTGSSAATSTVNEEVDGATVNPSISDGTNTPLYPGYVPDSLNFSNYRIVFYATGVATPTYRDTDGHMTNWVVDGMGRPTQTQECTASANQGQQCTGTWLVSNESWDVDNNLLSEVDPRGKETDYAYDVDGNAVAVGAPPPSPGASRPTSLYSYDGHDNVTAYCDPNATHGISSDWASAPTAPIPGQGGLCPQTSIATRYQWNSTSSEPFGELSSTTTPATVAAPEGYQRSYFYDLGPQGGTDFGLPTRVSGTVIAQSIDSATPSRQPQQTFWYDSNGNLVCYGTGNGQWLLAYDALGRLTSAADPDDASSGTGVCGKTGAQPGWSTTVRMAYYGDGSIASRSSASQTAAGIATTYTYDLDGDELTETNHNGCTPASTCTPPTTRKYYDGADRVVEVQQPSDAQDIQAYPWSTRYLYDLSKGGTTAYRGMGLQGYGNLVVTQELLSGTVWTPETNVGTTYPISTATWTSVRAASFDALDRTVATYEAAFGDTAKLTNTYDGPNQLGLLSGVALATGETKAFVYDDLGRLTDTLYPKDPSGSVTPQTHAVYDAAGRVTSRSTSALGSEMLSYDANGSLTSIVEPASLGGGTIAYHYYADGSRADVTYTGPPYALATVAQYAYRQDGKREILQLANGFRFAWSYTSGARLTSLSDPYTGTTIHPDATRPTATGGAKFIYPASMSFLPRTTQYDSYGRISKVTLPESFSYSYAMAQYDSEDAPAEETRSTGVQSLNGTTTVCKRSNVRQEQIALPAVAACASYSGASLPTDLNGTILINGSGASVDVTTGTSNGGAWVLDARAGMKLNNQVVDRHGVVTGSQYVYDASGRMVQDVEATDGPGPGTTYQNQASAYRYGTRTKSYDAENRLRTDVYPNPSASATMSYGTATNNYWFDSDYSYEPSNLTVDYDATSHPARITEYDAAFGTTQTLAWLWDGSDRFLECVMSNGQCAQLTFSLEGLADYDRVSGQSTVYDRNTWGLVVSSHTSTRFDQWADAHGNGPQMMPSAYAGACSDGDYSSSPACPKLRYGKLTNDGWTIDNDTWQGVRSIDLAVGTWNSPDPYAGSVHDPSSQKPYMWNHNNPYAYSDPSGFKIIWSGDIYDQKSAEQMYDQAIAYFRDHGATEAADLLTRLRDDPSFTIKGQLESGNGQTRFDSEKATLHWNTTEGLVPYRRDRITRAQSPALGLLHEADHALRYMTDPAGIAKDLVSTTDGYDDPEEKRVILGSEIRAAFALGEPMRWRHQAQGVCPVAPVTGTVCIK